MNTLFDDFDAEFEEPAKPALQPSKAFEEEIPLTRHANGTPAFTVNPTKGVATGYDDKGKVRFTVSDDIPESKEPVLYTATGDVYSLTDEDREQLELSAKEQESKIRDQFTVLHPEPGINVHFKKIDHSSMPQGLKEAQELNGVQDHGLGIMKPLDQRPITAGNFVKVGNRVIFQATEAGAFRIIDAYNVTPTIKDLLDRRFPDCYYCGDDAEGKVVYETKKTEVEKEPEASDAEINEAYEKYLKGNKGHVSFKTFKKDIYKSQRIAEALESYLSELPKEYIEASKEINKAMGQAMEEMEANPNIDPSMWKTKGTFGDDWIKGLEGMDKAYNEAMDKLPEVTVSPNLQKLFNEVVPEEKRLPTVILAGSLRPGFPKESFYLPVNPEVDCTGFDIEPEPDDKPEVDLFSQVAYEKATKESYDGKALKNPLSRIDEAGSFSYPERKDRPENTYYGSQATIELPAEGTAESDKLIKALKATPFPSEYTEKKPVHINDIVIDPSKLQTGVARTSVIPPRGGRAWIGIDPGKDGGIVVVDETSTIVEKLVIPKIGDDVDPLELYNFLDTMNYHYTATVVLEDVHSLFGMAAGTNFSMGHTLGIIEGIIAACQIRKVKVSPKTWQKAIWEKSDMEYKPLQPEKKKASTDTKQTSMKAAHRLFPKDDFRKSARSKNDHDGICDAACLAEYGRRNNF